MNSINYITLSSVAARDKVVLAFDSYLLQGWLEWTAHGVNKKKVHGLE